jgi:hypothetical protein
MGLICDAAREFPEAGKIFRDPAEDTVAVLKSRRFRKYGHFNDL